MSLETRASTEIDRQRSAKMVPVDDRETEVLGLATVPRDAGTIWFLHHERHERDGNLLHASQVAGVLRRLAEQGYIQRVPGTERWQITSAGRDALGELNPGEVGWCPTPKVSAAHLHLEDYSTILFNDGTFRWFNEHGYRICGADSTTTDREVLASLLAQPSYETSTLERSQRKSTPERDRVHGPYWLRCITPDRFDAIDLTTARERLTAWGQIDGDGIPPKGLHEVDRLEEVARAATGLFWLQDLDDECVLPWNYFDAWAEFVIVDRKRGDVLLVAASGD
jgi:hypothetical protein